MQDEPPRKSLAMIAAARLSIEGAGGRAWRSERMEISRLLPIRSMGPFQNEELHRSQLLSRNPLKDYLQHARRAKVGALSLPGP
jgi:hypothetical protein